MTDEQVDQLSRAIDAADRVIAAVRDGQWSGPTPCTGWNVADLVRHLSTGNQRFAAALDGDTPAPAPDPAAPGGDPLSQYRQSAAVMLAAFRQPGALGRIVTVPFGTVPGIVALNLRVTEALVHGWDLARATGQTPRFPTDLTEEALAFSRDKLGEIPPDRRPFAPAQPVADDAPAIDRLAACLGRDVSRWATA
jgi:uncharacterized protein (TIGR03086 family)